MAIDKTLAAELEPGMVVHLCPKTMLTKGGTVTGPAHSWVQDFHFFLVLTAEPKRCLILPMYSNEGPGRQPISIDGRKGHPKWTGGTWNYHPAQIWTVSRQSIARAAEVAHDQSTTGNRNRLAAEFVPDLSAAPK